MEGSSTTPTTLREGWRRYRAEGDQGAEIEDELKRIKGEKWEKDITVAGNE